MITSRKLSMAVSIAVGLSAGFPLVHAADPAKIAWSKIKAADVPLFFPGQASYEWVRSPAHEGNKKVQAGQACNSCHDEDGAERDLGEKMVKGGAL